MKKFLRLSFCFHICICIYKQAVCYIRLSGKSFVMVTRSLTVRFHSLVFHQKRKTITYYIASGRDSLENKLPNTSVTSAVAPILYILFLVGSFLHNMDASIFIKIVANFFFFAFTYINLTWEKLREKKFLFIVHISLFVVTKTYHPLLYCNIPSWWRENLNNFNLIKLHLAFLNEILWRLDLRIYCWRKRVVLYLHYANFPCSNLRANEKYWYFRIGGYYIVLFSIPRVLRKY